jgi:putative sterol carrier protein
MSIPFATEAWIQALQSELNQSASYRESARNWEGDFYFVITLTDGAASAVPPVYLYMDLWHGECRAACAVADPAARSPEFVIEAPLATWRKVVEKKLDPIQGLVTRQLKLKGPLTKVLRAPMAAMNLVACCTHIDTEWAPAAVPAGAASPN